MTELHDGLRWGYTVADLQTLARVAVTRNTGRDLFSPTDRYDLAFSGIALHLYSAEQPPEPSDLIKAGWTAIAEARIDEGHHHGVNLTGPPQYRGQIRPAFANYWAFEARHADGPEDRLVERIALDQIWPTLTARQQEALGALAVHGTAKAAALAIGLSHSAFHTAAHLGRARARALWHEGETPPKAWGRDRRTVDGAASYRAARRAVKRRETA